MSSVALVDEDQRGPEVEGKRDRCRLPVIELLAELDEQRGGVGRRIDPKPARLPQRRDGRRSEPAGVNVGDFAAQVLDIDGEHRNAVLPAEI